MVATYDDANLIVQLVRWSTEIGLDDASHTLFAEGFEPESSSVDEPAVRKALTFGEVIGTLVKQGVLDRGLVLDLWWPSGTWARVKPSAVQERERLGEPRLYENFEALASGPSS
jgi:hypothetical protein